MPTRPTPLAVLLTSLLAACASASRPPTAAPQHAAAPTARAVSNDVAPSTGPVLEERLPVATSRPTPAPHQVLAFSDGCNADDMPKAHCASSGPVCATLKDGTQHVLLAAKNMCALCRYGMRQPSSITKGSCEAAYDKRRADHGLDRLEKPIVASTQLCERENPYFDGHLTCLAFGQERFPGRQCDVTLGETIAKPMGSCRTCRVACH